jgi:hypothetical protein
VSHASAPLAAGASALALAAALGQAEGTKVLKILHNGQDVLKCGLTTQPGDEVKEVTIVVGPEPAADSPDAKSPAGDARPAGQQ